MEKRNRAEGWKHAKRSGHKNESIISRLTKEDEEIQKRIFTTAKISKSKIKSIEPLDGKEVYVDCIFEGTTTSKTDVYINLVSGESINVSIKKSEGGQVFLIGIDRFIEGFEKQYNKLIPDDVKRAISLFWGSAEDTLDIVKKYGYGDKSYETRKHRLVKETLDAYNKSLSNVLIDWFNKNMENIFDFCFSKGLAKYEKDWAKVLWYKNELSENDLDDLFLIDEIKKKLPKNAEFGNRNGGTTIQLPFGFVQWHSPTKVIPGSIQFHHNYIKIKELMEG